MTTIFLAAVGAAWLPTHARKCNKCVTWGGAGAGCGLVIGVGNSIPFLELPLQTFVLGTALGMTAALVEYAMTRSMERWSLTIAYLAVPFFWMGAAVQGLIAIL